jgi:hypothetical protein
VSAQPGAALVVGFDGAADLLAPLPGPASPSPTDCLPEETEPCAAEREQLSLDWTAMMLSPTLEIAEALLRLEAVPLGRLDPKWVARLAAEPPLVKARVSLADFATVPLEYDPFPNGARRR